MTTPFFIAIVGGSASGKTCLAEAVARHFQADGAHLISEDDYYVDAGRIPGFDPARFNFDEPAAKDHDLLCQHLTALKTGRGVDMPLYDFATHCRRDETRWLEPEPLIVLEGLHLLTSDALAELMDLTVFVDASRDVRYARRLARDVNERARTPESVRHQFDTIVEPMHGEHVEPQRTRADLVIANMGAPDFDRLAAPVIARTRLASGFHKG
jgi:uridine kinase